MARPRDGRERRCEQHHACRGGDREPAPRHGTNAKELEHLGPGLLRRAPGNDRRRPGWGHREPSVVDPEIGQRVARHLGQLRVHECELGADDPRVSLVRAAFRDGHVAGIGAFASGLNHDVVRQHVRDYAEDMCGICGVIQLTGEPREPVSAGRLAAMADALRHRGPDDRGTHLAPGIALGVRRLSIVDIAGGHQPMASEDGTIVAIQNGELYNHERLRTELRREGHVLTTRSDTEILPHVYEQHGDAFPASLHGDFAIAVWDATRRRAVLARDRMGVKPLYWARRGDLVVFGSELKAMLASGLVEAEIDVEAIDLYLTLGFVPGNRTPLREVRKLAPGSALIVDGGRVEEVPYWRYPEPRPDVRARPLDEYASELLELLRTSVRDRLMGDVPVGAMLSGGLDSSLAVALMAEASDRAVPTFSVGFREDARSELDDARLVAQAFGCDHHELSLSLEDDAVDLDELLWNMDEPVADLSALGFDLLCRLASQHVKVALAGQGADELFGGYTKHRAAAAIGSLERLLPGPVRGGLAGVPWPSERARRAARALGAADPALRLLEMSGRLVDGRRGDLYRGALSDVPTENAHATVLHALGEARGDALSTTLYLDAKLGLVDHMLLYFDRTSMAHSLEVRVPFLDHRLVEWAATVPSSMKVQRSVGKRVLRAAGARLLPAHVLEKRKVGFFRFAAEGWLRAQLDGEAGTRLLAADAAYQELLSREAVLRLIAEYRDHRDETRARLILAILLLDSWLTSFPQRAAAQAA